MTSLDAHTIYAQFSSTKGESAMVKGIPYPQMLHHLHAHQIVDLTTGRHTTIMLSLKLLISCTVTTKCLQAILILYSICGQLH
jgi:hypothetical protein